MIVISLLFLYSCNSTDINEVDIPSVNPKTELGKRFMITGDFNGDGKIDTLKESYCNEKTKVELNKNQSRENGIKDFNKIASKFPISMLNANSSKINSYQCNTDYYNCGLYLLENLGDLNNDHIDEVGYVLDLADLSYQNSYTIISYLPDSGWKKIYKFPISEMTSFDDENMFPGRKLIKKLSNYQFIYKAFNTENLLVDENTVTLH
jgi:hypothetical protein